DDGAQRGYDQRSDEAENISGHQDADHDTADERAQNADDDVHQTTVATTADNPACYRACEQPDDEPGQPPTGIKQTHFAVILSASIAGPGTLRDDAMPRLIAVGLLLLMAVAACDAPALPQAAATHSPAASASGSPAAGNGSTRLTDDACRVLTA